jgi:hypothetical protein
MMDDELLPVVAKEMQEIEASDNMHYFTAEWAVNELQIVGIRAHGLLRQLKNMKRRLVRNTERLCAALDAIN